MCFHKYVLSGINVLHTILVVDWLKECYLCNFEENSWDCHDTPFYVATLILLCCNIITLCRNKDWFNLLEIAGNYVVT